MMDAKAKIYSFGEFQLVLEERTLLRGGEPVALQPKCFDTLAYLVENSGRVLEKDELIQTLWPDSFVEEGNLAQNIFVLRKVLGDDRNGHSFIKTIPRRGYKFVAPVALAEPANGNVPAAYWGQHSPFRSLRAFEAEDAWLFFGREAEIGELLDRLGRSPVLVVAGNSGCGKSSLLRAGLVSALNEGGGEEAAWRIAVFRPSANPFDYLAEVLPGLLAPELSAKEQAELIADCRSRFPSDENALRDAISALAGANRVEAGPTRVLLVADQFEEIFTLTSSKETRDRYIDLLLAAARPHGPVPVHLVLALRADFYANCLEHAGLSRCLETNLYNVPRMGREQLREAIEKRLELAAAQAEPGLIDALLEDAGEEPGNLALLEHALGQLWSKCGGFSRTLTNSAYAEIGRLRGALGRHADEVYHGLRDEREKRLAQRIFLELVTVGENAGVQDTRRTMRKKDLLALSGAPEDTEQLLAALASSRLISTSGEGEDAFAEVSHEALIREWPLLREWIAQNREELRLERRLLQAAEEWQALHRDSGALLQGARLAQAEEWLARHSEMSTVLREFLEASIAARVQAEGQRLRKQKAAATRAKRISWALAVLLLAGLSIAWFAHRVERSRSLAAESGATQAHDHAAALALAIRAWRTAKTDEARVAVTTAFPQLLTTLKHDGVVVVSVFSPDGSRILTASSDHTARIWNCANGNLLATLDHADSVTFAAFSPAGDRIVTASSDHTARIWSVTDGHLLAVLRGHLNAIGRAVFSPNGRLLATLQGHSLGVYLAQFSPDGQLIVTASYDGTARVWNVTNGRSVNVLQHDGFVQYAEFSPDGKRIATASWDHTARLWSSMDGRLLFVLHNDGPVTRAVFSPRGQRVVTIGYDKTARVWNVADGRLLFMLEHEDRVEHAEFSRDGEYLVTAGYDQKARVWRSADGLLVATLSGHTHAVNHAAFSPSGDRIVTGSVDNTARLWSLNTAALVADLRGHRQSIADAEFSRDGQRIVTASMDHTSKVWRAVDGGLLFTLQGHTGVVRQASFSRDGQRIVTASDDHTVKVWRAVDGGLLFTLQGHTGLVRQASFSPDGQRIVTASDDHTAKVWRAVDGGLLFTLQGHTERIYQALFSPDGQLIVTASMDHTAKVWNTGDGRLLFTLPGSVYQAAFSPDGQRIVTTGGIDHRASMWIVADGRLLATIGDGQVTTAAFSQDGEYVITGGRDGTAQIWSGANFSLVATLRGHWYPLATAQFSPDGQSVLTASFDETARVWKAGDGHLQTILQTHGMIAAATFSPDGQCIITGGTDETAHIWRIFTLHDMGNILSR
ncbi:MAG TPA: winged helix-turn-helix domain-containing protein [Candidatus Angelobacter sp.]|nr:winged helix-turn-helix domain-containing protein [Candidatus Angelobacter sp.]